MQTSSRVLILFTALLPFTALADAHQAAVYLASSDAAIAAHDIAQEMPPHVRQATETDATKSAVGGHTKRGATKGSDAHARAPAGPAHPAPSSASPWQTLAALMDGNQRFVAGQPRHPAQSTERRLALASGQQPKAIVLSCSDSRVPPELIFDQGLGELFVVRTAGEVAEPSAVASIEYAVEHLGANLILVLGHTSCGAVKATLSTPEGSTAGSPNLDRLVSLIRPHVHGMKIPDGDTEFEKPVRAQVAGVAQELIENSAILRHQIAADALMVVQGVYHLDSGKVVLEMN